MNLPPYKPAVTTKTQAFQIVLVTGKPHLIIHASTWMRVILSRLLGADDAVVIGHNKDVQMVNGNPLNALDDPMEIVLSPGDELYYRSTITSAPISVMACAVPGIVPAEAD